MNDNQKTIIAQVLVQIKANQIVTEEIIKKYVNVFKVINNITAEEEEEVMKELHAKLLVRMDRGSCIKAKDHVTWYYSAKKEINPVYWERYRAYLAKKTNLNAAVIDALDKSTDEMMDLLGNPKIKEAYSRRGLVIGDVQSGKTSTYIALINKASDAGYKVIILLTGTIEKLRRQTQGRLDEGFIGLDSTTLIRDKNKKLFGVGEIDGSFTGWALTSTSNDFTTKIAKQAIGKLASLNCPVIFVVKKNKGVLEQLEEWLRQFNANLSDNKIDLPMIMIDDEADNASANTSKDDELPKTINRDIRQLLNLFTHSNYVAFTATPFANIFINPYTDDEMLKDDLFPRDFIYALDAPSTYIGPDGIFKDNGKYSYMLKDNEDCEYYLPEKHKIDFVPKGLPESLKQAIACFFIANAIRDLRGDTNQHRTMLVNISRFINVQEIVCQNVEGYVRMLQREIRSYYLMGTEALKHENIAFIKTAFDENFANISNAVLGGEKRFTWSEIQKALYPAVAAIVVRTVNGGNAARNLNYDENEAEGLRIIAVGGISLSRGLTLEGLCTSYYHRNSRMYDTLMQMGRWFGYRAHYADICTVWMTKESAEWYGYISDSANELRREVRRMENEGKTPIEFGLKVRSDKDALIVTAVNKMRSAKDIEVAVSLDGEVIETPYLSYNKDVLNSNFILTQNWVKVLFKNGYSFADNNKLDLALKKYHQILNVHKKYILEYLASFNSNYLNIHFQTEDIIRAISEYTDGTVDRWDIIFASGDGKQIENWKEIQPSTYVVRSFNLKKLNGSRALQLSKQNARLGSANLCAGGLTVKQKQEIEAAAKKLRPFTEQEKEMSDSEFFSTGMKRNPLLIIYPVILNHKKSSEEDDEEKSKIVREFAFPLIGLGIGIPSIDGREKITYKYKINLVKYRELLGIDDDFGEYDDTNQE